MKDIHVTGLSDVGQVRLHNEDSILLTQHQGWLLAVVADGMGGHIGGRQASQTAVQTVKHLSKMNQGKLPAGELIEDCLLLAHRRIRELSGGGEGKLAMGTTCTIVYLQEKDKGTSVPERVDLPPEPLDEEQLGKNEDSYQVSLGHVGDSKLYHFAQNGDIVQRSTDHTMAQKLLDSGVLKAEDMDSYPHKNIIYKSLGGQGELDIDPIESFQFRRNEALLLCSDGLSNYVNSAELISIIRKSSHVSEAAKYMVHLANVRGGDDNISVIIIEHGSLPRLKSGQLERLPRIKRKKRYSRTRLIILLTILLVSLICLLLDQIRPGLF